MHIIYSNVNPNENFIILGIFLEPTKHGHLNKIRDILDTTGNRNLNTFHPNL